MLDTVLASDFREVNQNIRDRDGSGSNVIQAAFRDGATGSVRVLGRVTTDMPWVQIDEVTQDALIPIIHCPLLRFETTISNANGTRSISVRKSL